MDPNAQVAVPPSVAAANVEREAAAAAAAAAAKEKDDSKGKEEPSPEEDVKKEAGEAPAAAPPPEKPAPPVKGGKKGKAAAKGKKGAKGKKVAEEVEAPAPEAADKEEEAVKEEDAATPMDVGKDAQAAQAAQAAAIAAQAAMQQQFAQQQQFQQQHDQQFLVHQQQQLQMMGAMQPQPGQEQMFAAATAQHQLSGTGPDGTQQPVGIDLKKQIFAGMKGALAMELEPVEETLAMMREVCGPAWRQRATSLMRGPPFPKLIELHELKETAVAAGLCPGGGVDPLADRAFALESAGQLWLEHAATVVEDKSIPIEAARVLLREGRALPVHLKDELEELGERCELYCVCRSAYDAKRSMICCDRCDGWFHYECIGMQPPGLDEQEEANIKFACPQCCENQGIPYVPFRPLR
jgi:histone demethylase JARID1